MANSVGRGIIIARRHAGTDLGGTLRRTGGKPFKGKLKTRFPAKLREIGRFGGQMEIILASLKGELHKGPFLKHLLNQANAWANLNELLKLETFQHGNDSLL